MDAVNYIKKNVETYFHPNSKRNPYFKNNKVIPTHVSETYLNNLRTSKLFTRDFVALLKQNLKLEAEMNIINSIKKNCKKWAKVYSTKGSKILMKNMMKRFKENPKGKFPWGVQEVDIAIQKILFKLGQV